MRLVEKVGKLQEKLIYLEDVIMWKELIHLISLVLGHGPGQTLATAAETRFFARSFGGRMPRCLVLAVLGIVMSALPLQQACAWDLSFNEGGQTLGSGYCDGLALGDVDNDGDLDIFLCNYDGPSKVYLNNGAGTFTDSGQSLGSGDSIIPVLGDLDGDGDLDAFVTNINGQSNKVWLNDGSGNFTDSGQTLGNNGVGAALGDLDGDGDLDIFIATDNGSGQPDEVWLNDGSGNFSSNGQSLGNEGGRCVALGDVDDDGDLDAFVANVSGGNKVWLNNGSGIFTDSGQTPGSLNSTGVQLGDLDRDGDLDAFVSTNGNQPDKVWLNNGSGTFSDSGQALGSETGTDVWLGDLDGDGDLDAFVANYNYQPDKVWLNNGSGVFSDSGLNIGSVRSTCVMLGDVDSDGDLDAVVGSQNNGNKVWVSEGKPNFIISFADSGQSLNHTHGVDVGLGDLDHDGDLDAFVANYDTGGSQVWLNNGSGTLTDSGQRLGNTANTDTALGDLDGDGDLDAFVTRYSYGNQVWLNNGAGVFTDSGQNLSTAGNESVMLGDLDRDGDLDAFIGKTGPKEVWLNNGSGTFTDSGQRLGPANDTWSFDLGDVDGDGDLDAFVPYRGGTPAKVWLNNGSGVFTDSGQNLGSDNVGDAKLADLDGDGDLDAFVANGAGWGNAPDKVWFNNGSGVFTDSGQSLGNDNSQYVALADLDRDGDIDAFVTNRNQPCKVWLNNGAGTFVDSGLALGSAESWDVTLGDVDRDGDLDAYVSNGALNGGADKLWLNNSTPTPADIAARSDLEPDGDVDFVDFSALALAWLTTPGEPNWNPVCDISDPNDDVIDGLDLAVFANDWLSEREILVAWWKFDEGSGTTAYDSACSNDGTISEAAWTSGKIGGALSFDGVNDYVSCPNDVSLNVPGGLTISAWVYMNATGVYPAVVTKGAGTNDWGYCLQFKSDTRKIDLFLENANESWVNSAKTPVPLSQWTHIAAVYGSNTIRYYFNGTPDGSYTVTGGSIKPNSANLLIGKRIDGFVLNGKIDDLRIYNEALSPKDILRIYQSGL